MLNQDSRILSSVVFGCGQMQAGALIDPACNFDATDENELKAFIRSIRYIILLFIPPNHRNSSRQTNNTKGERTGTQAFTSFPRGNTVRCRKGIHPTKHMQMIIIKQPNKPFQYTAKGTPRRQAIIADYEPEITTLYGGPRTISSCHLVAPDRWDLKSTSEFVRSVVCKTLDYDMSDDEDIFQHGCDR